MRCLEKYLLLALVCISSHCYASLAQSPPDSRSSKIVLLGTGTPNPDPDRSGSAIAIVVDDTPYLVDFGPGVVRRAAAAARSGPGGLAAAKLGRAFVTHLHSDHTAGYPDLILSPWVLGRDKPLEVYGPEGIGEMTDHILSAYRRDIDMRMYGLEPANSEGYKVNAHEIKKGVIYKDTNVTVEAFPVQHGSWPDAFGFKFTVPDRTIVISGDTRPSQSIVEHCNGCDVLIHEVYSQKGFEKRPAVWQKYHSSFHTSAPELADIASRAKPGLLILYHQLFWGTTPQELIREIRDAGFEGRVVSGRDLEVY